MDFVLRHLKPSRLRPTSLLGGRKQDMMLESCSSLNLSDSGIGQTMDAYIPATVGDVVADPVQLTTVAATPGEPSRAPVMATAVPAAIVKKSSGHKSRNPKPTSKKGKSANVNAEDDASEAATLNESSDSSERSREKRKKQNAKSQSSAVAALYTSRESSRSAKKKLSSHEKDQEHDVGLDETVPDLDGPSMSSVSVEPEELLGSRTSLNSGASRTSMGTSHSSLVQFVVPPVGDQPSKSCSEMCRTSGMAASEKNVGGTEFDDAVETEPSLLDQVKPKDLLSASEHSPCLRRRDPLLSGSQHRRKKDVLAGSSHQKRRDVLASSAKESAGGQLPPSSHRRSASSDGSTLREGRSSRGPTARTTSHRRSHSEVSQNPSSNPAPPKAATHDKLAALVETPTSRGPRRKMRSEASEGKSASGESRKTESRSRSSSPTPRAPRESPPRELNSPEARRRSRGEMRKSAPPADAPQAEDQPKNGRGRASNRDPGDTADSEQNNPSRRRRRSTSRSRLASVSGDPSNRLAKAEAPPVTQRTRAQRRSLNKASKEEYDFDDGYRISRGMRRSKSNDLHDSSRSVGASPLRGVGRTTSFPASFHRQGISTSVELDFDNVSLPDSSAGRQLERQGSGRSLCSMPALATNSLPLSGKIDRLGQCATPRPRLGRSLSARSLKSDSGKACNVSLSALSSLNSVGSISKRRPSLSSVGSKSSAAEDMAADALSRIPRRS